MTVKNKRGVTETDAEDIGDQAGANPYPGPTEKEELLELLQKLKDLGVNSIGDLEVKISRL